MRMMVLAGTAFLAACGGGDRNDTSTMATGTTSTDAGTAPTMGQAPAANAAANAGTYEMTTSDGTVHTAQLAVNSTYTLAHGGTQMESGTWRAVGAQLCFTPQGGTEACYTGSAPGAEGTFTMSGPAGSLLNGAIVRKTAAATS